MARRRSTGRRIKAKLRDIDRGYKRLMKRLGVKARKARRSTSRAFKSTKNTVKKAIKNATRKGVSAKSANAWRVTVGIHESEGIAEHTREQDEIQLDGDKPPAGKPPTVAEVAMFNEFGLGVPQRSFVRAWADENEAENRENLRKIGQAVVKGKLPGGPKQGLERFGLLAQGGIQKRMADGVPPPNAPSTVAQKKSSKPLIAGGQLRSSVTYKVFKPGKAQ